MYDTAVTSLETLSVETLLIVVPVSAVGTLMVADIAVKVKSSVNDDVTTVKTMGIVDTNAVLVKATIDVDVVDRLI